MRRLRWKSDYAWIAAAALAVSLHFWFPPIGEGIRHDTYSTADVGQKAFFRLAEETAATQGTRVSRNSSPLLRWANEAAGNARGRLLCVLGPQRYPNPAEWEALGRFVQNGGALVIAARDEEPDFEATPFAIEVAAAPLVDEVDANFASDIAAGDDGFFWESTAEVSKGGHITLVDGDGSPQAVRSIYGNGTVVVVASDSPFSNEALAWGNHATGPLAYRLLEVAGIGYEIAFDESLNESATPKVVSLLLHDPFRPLTVQLVVCLILYGWWQSRRFGPLIPEAAKPRQNVVDHTNAAGALHYRSKDGAGALRAYVRKLVLDLKLKSHRRHEERVLEPIALRMGTTAEEVKRTIQQAAKLSRTPPVERRTAATMIRHLAAIRAAARRPEKAAR